MKSLISLLIVLISILLGTKTSEAAVICKKKNGVMVVRDAQCKKKETQLNIADFGAIGPQGPQGPQGIQGPAGPSVSPIPADQRFAVMWQVSGGVHHVSVRGDGSIRDTDDNTVAVTKVDVGRWCISAPGALEGAVGVLQNQGSSNGNILVSMGIGSFCNTVAGSNITVETFSFE